MVAQGMIALFEGAIALVLVEYRAIIRHDHMPAVGKGKDFDHVSVCMSPIARA